MTPEQLTEIRKRLEKATPGPTGHDSPICALCNSMVCIRDGYEWEDGDICDHCAEDLFPQFQADIAALLQEVERLSQVPVKWNESIYELGYDAGMKETVKLKEELESTRSKWFEVQGTCAGYSDCIDELLADNETLKKQNNSIHHIHNELTDKYRMRCEESARLKEKYEKLREAVVKGSTRGVFWREEALKDDEVLE